MQRRLTVLLISLLALLFGAASSSRADVATQLPVQPYYEPWMAVDPVDQHVFVAASSGTSSIYVLDFDGNLVKTITGEDGASGMAVDKDTHTLYVALDDAGKISEIDTKTLTETTRFPAETGVFDVAVAGGKLWFTTANNETGSLYEANLDGTNVAPAGFGGLDLLASSADGKLLALGDHETEPPSVQIYDVSGATPTLVGSPPFTDSPAQVADLAFDPSGTTFYMASGYPYFIPSFSVGASSLTAGSEYPTGPYPTAVAVSPDGKFVAGGIGGQSGEPDLFVYPAGTITPVQTVSIGSGGVEEHSLAFSPDGSRLFALATDPNTGDLELDVIGDTDITEGPDASTYATKASFDFESRDSNASFECKLDTAAWSACTSPQSYSNLSPGSHTFAVRNVDGLPADPIDSSRTWTIKPPDTILQDGPGSPANPTISTGASFFFTSDDTTATFQCSLDGDAWSACTSPANYSNLGLGSHTFRVKAVNDAGAVDPTGGAQQTWEIVSGPPPPPPGSVIGVSINNGDYATNSPDVQLDVVWPADATEALISNDGGFGSSGGTETVPVAATIPWTLESSGSDRLPQIVYLRFPDSATPTVTFTDDIVLDTTTPSVLDASLNRHTAKAHSTVVAGRLHKVRLRAKEKISGISQVRFSARRSGGTTLTLTKRTTRGVLSLSRTLSVRMSARPRWVRVCSAAGNWSKWHRVR